VKQRASVIVTDLDNTLFDWVGMTFYLDRSFSELLACVELTPFERDEA